MSHAEWEGVQSQNLQVQLPIVLTVAVVHYVTCYPTQVNAPGLTPALRQVLDLSTPEGWKAELT